MGLSYKDSVSIWAIADLHLSFGVPNKEMDIFGSQWVNHAEKIEHAWRETVSPEDLVLIPGDISWAMTLDEVKPDLDWIERLPGTKVLLKGNHDYWWSAISKVQRVLPPSCHVIQNNSYTWNGIAIAGTRLWDTPEYGFEKIISIKKTEGQAKQLTQEDHSEERERIFQRELGRLEASLKEMDPKAQVRIAMTHYPPIGLELAPSRVSEILEKHRVDICVFGHLHNVDPSLKLFGRRNGVSYYFAACDHLNFHPIKIK